MMTKALPIILFGTISYLDISNAFTLPVSIKPHISITSKGIRNAAEDFIPPVAGELNLSDGREDDGLAGTTDQKQTALEKADEILNLKATVEGEEKILRTSQEAAAVADASFQENVAGSIPLIPVQMNSNNTIEVEQDSSAASKVADNTAPTIEQTIDFPSVGRIMKFATSATGVFLCSPLLSLIDTSAVGLLAGTAQQAALNPAVAVTDYAALLMAFLYTGATNLVAAAQDDEQSKTISSFSSALQLSGYVGTALGCFLFIFARQLIGTLIGNDSIGPDVFNAALKYVRIRALGMPAAAIIGSAQAGCLGMQDIRSPLYVLGAAAVINFIGDSIFVRLKHPWFGGAAGAAWATIFSQYAAVAFFVKWLCFKPKILPKNVISNDDMLDLTGESKRGKGRRLRLKKALKSFAKKSPGYIPARNLKRALEAKKENSISSRGLLAGKFKAVDLFKLPNSKQAKEFSPFVIPVTTTQIGRVSSYLAMSHVVSSTLGTAAMAAQQIIVSLFYCLTPITDSLSLTAQSIIPGISERKSSRARAVALKESMKNLFIAGGIYAGAMISIVLSIPLLSRFFTSDPHVIMLVNSVVPLLVAFFGMDAVLMAAEGLLLGQKDLNYIGKMYGVFFFAVPYFMFRVKRAALAGNPTIKLTSVWTVFVMYEFARLTALVARALLVQRRSDLKAKETEQTEYLVFE